jgi:hypothetical protein
MRSESAFDVSSASEKQWWWGRGNGRTDLATHLSEALVDEGIGDIEEIANYGVALGSRRIRQTRWIAPPVLDVGVGDEQSDRQEESFSKRAKQGTHDGRQKVRGVAHIIWYIYREPEDP